MLKVLRENLREAVVFRVGPDVRIEPVQLVRCTSANRVAQTRLVWIEYRELFQEFLRFPQSVGRFEDRVAANRARYRCDELDDRLVRSRTESSMMPRLRISTAIFCFSGNRSSNR